MGDGAAAVAQYWAWVEEVQPTLPKDFKLKFEIHADLLRDEIKERARALEKQRAGGRSSSRSGGGGGGGKSGKAGAKKNGGGSAACVVS